MRISRFLPLMLMLLAASFARADCPGGSNTSCVTSFTISPGAIVGDNAQTAIGSATAHLAPNANGMWILELKQTGLFFNCVAPALNQPPNGGGGGFAGGCSVQGTSVQVEFYSLNNTGSPFTAPVTADAAYNNDTGIPGSLVVNPPATQPTNQEPDGPCSDCGSGGTPINFANGDTWITQLDYSIPGLGGGLNLSRTWNSLWPLLQGPEQSGVFGDSWRSSFEERIQVLTGEVVRYWKGNGSSLFFTYNNLSGAYALTAPFDDQTALSYSSTTAQWTVFQKDGTQRFFNSGGYLTSIVDRNGNTINISVDAANQNRIASVTDAASRVLTFNYADPNFPHLCTSIADSAGTVATYHYNSGLLSQVVYADGSQFNFVYDSNSLILSVTDSAGKVIEAHTYDSQRRGLTSQQANDSNGNPINKLTVSAYSAQETDILDSRNNFSRAYFSLLGQRHYLVQTNGTGCSTCGFNVTMQSLISPSGYIVRTGDPGGLRPWQYTYDVQGNMTSVGKPYGNPAVGGGPNGFYIWNYTYISFGEVLTVTDPLAQQALDPNHTTTNAYDTHGNLLSVTTPPPDASTAASTTIFTYNSNGTLKTIKDPLGHLTTTTYFPSGLINTIKDANNKITTYNYDARGNRTSVIDPVNGSTKPTTFGYDSMNRLTSITYPGATTSIQFHYDYRGRRDWIIDQNGFKTTYAYDDADRLTSVTDAQSPTPGVTRYVYDTEGNLTDTTTPSAITPTWTTTGTGSG